MRHLESHLTINRESLLVHSPTLAAFSLNPVL